MLQDEVMISKCQELAFRCMRYRDQKFSEFVYIPVVNAARAQPALNDLEPTTLAQNHVLDRDTHVLKQDLAMTLWRVVIAEHGHGAHDGDARGVGGNDDEALLAMLFFVLGIALPHDEVDRAAWVTGARNPPLKAVNDVLITDALDRGLDVGGVGRGDLLLSHSKGRAYFAVQERLEPFFLLGWGAIFGEDLHVAGVGGGAVASLRKFEGLICHGSYVSKVIYLWPFGRGCQFRRAQKRHDHITLAISTAENHLLLLFIGAAHDNGSVTRDRSTHLGGDVQAPTHDLCHKSVLEVAQASTLRVLLGQEEVPKAERAGLRLEFLHNWGDNLSDRSESERYERWFVV
ncbi:hypothetical protein BC938DRAFT_471649 [Jimgerdemannia flammicorona]|uniref:Uncharacterized protein n=1 Tax=Jimgerdemannia flammicorona TaxID=994334 RepID=A0A433QZY9_9FUNG|nr:hypothetical protein BC938DRAFT_471649 [Jimgerdemannia flammicorona]